MNKIISSAIAVSAILIGSVAISSFLIAPVEAKDECSGHPNCGARKIQTKETYYGIQATLTLPQQVIVANDGSYIAFYLGFDDTCEGGISYGSSKPGEKPGLGWRKFLNCGLNDRISKPLDNQSHGKINLKLVKNKDGFASLYINGVLAYTAKKTRLGKNPTVKAVHSTYNPASPSTLNSYANSSFTNIKVKISPDESGSYKLLPSQPISKKPWPNFKGYTESKDTNNVLETSLRR